MVPLTTFVSSTEILSTREYTISDLAREFSVSLRTLRFYEDRGLVMPRRQGTTRFYSNRDRARLSTDSESQATWITLSEIKKMVASEATGSEPISLPLSTVEEQISHLERQRHEIEAALADLRALKGSFVQAA